MNRIFLIGYMGSGKTTIGRLVADRLGYRLVYMSAESLSRNVCTKWLQLKML